ncbi:MAG: hypothetical protein IT462_03500 [Planctomycetes bacterium]|nr:hypothetical protein [Planctomycetota bacterium]
MTAFLALASAYARDQLRRGATLVLAVIGVLLVMSLRYFSAFGLGYETVQLRELGAYSIGLTGALAVLIFCLPREDDDGASDSLLVTRPLPPPVISAGVFFGRLIVVTALVALWTAALCGAIAWYAVGEPMMFSYRGETSVMAECLSLAGPIAGQWMILAMLLAAAQALARFARPLPAAMATIALYLAGFAATAAPPALAWMLPDFARYDLTSLLWGDMADASPMWLLPHMLCWTTAALAVDSAGLRLRLAA